MSEQPRSFVLPDDPRERPVRHRATVRVLLVDDRDRILLFNDSDPGLSRDWWITPGGGIDPGESEVDAVARELAEETGLRITIDQVRGPVAHRHVVHGYSDQIVEQDDTFYAVLVAHLDVDTVGHTEEEQITMLGHHWWSRSEIAATGEELWPLVLPRLWALLDAPASWPVTLPDVEESSLPI